MHVLCKIASVKQFILKAFSEPVLHVIGLCHY